MNKKEKVFSLTIESALQLIGESEEQVSIARELIAERIEDAKNDYASMTLCECFSINCKIIEKLDFILQNAELKIFEEEDAVEKDQLLINAKQMMFIETLILARYYVSQDLVALNISTQLH